MNLRKTSRSLCFALLCKYESREFKIYTPHAVLRMLLLHQLDVMPAALRNV